jgi:excisionase family DNA binding protein
LRRQEPEGYRDGDVTAQQYMTVEEAAKLLRCSIRSVHARTAAREIPCRRLPGTRRVLFLLEELEAWIENGGTIALEVVDGPRGGFVARPRGDGAAL